MILPCSGASDVGEIADKAARKLSNEEYGDMSCLAGIGAGLSGFIASAKGADEVITIDGCEVHCARKTVEKIGVTPKSYTVTELGFEKGSTPVTENVVQKVVDGVRGERPVSKGCCEGNTSKKGTGSSCCG
jgi:uncharacterized metal-binding protein